MGKRTSLGRAPRKVAAPFARRLVIMVKEPVMGRVKTRLAREVGAVSATAFYRTNASTVLARLAGDSRWRTEISVAPDTATGGRAWPGSIRRSPQGSGDLGRRMQRIFDRAPPGPVIVVGTDIPEIRADHIADAFRALARHVAVLGATPDGGYWLVGLRRTPRTLRIFSGVRWSSEHTRADTIRNLGCHSVAYVAMLSDVDAGSDMASSSPAIGRRILPHA